MSQARSGMAVPAVAAVVALPALLPPFTLGGFVGERFVYLPATVALGLWAWPRSPWPVLLAGALCAAFLGAPRGPGLWSYSWPDFVLCAAVAWSLLRMDGDPVLVALAATLWIADALLLAPWCGVLAGWQFTASTACGSVWGDPIASVPALLVLAGWLMWLRHQPGS